LYFAAVRPLPFGEGSPFVHDFTTGKDAFLAYPACGRMWGFKDNIFDFKEAME
jgi:hypothetical protein